MSNTQDDIDGIEDLAFEPVEQTADESPTSTEPNLEEMSVTQNASEEFDVEKTAEDLEAVFDVPVRISVVLGRTQMPVSNLLKMDVGTVIELDRQVGEAIDIYVSDRLVARGEIVLVEDKLGVTMTEIIKAS
jgi:flagellar motor switch protein FliN/FliY